VLAIVLGAVGVGLGVLLGRVAWAGRVSASVEEYALDDSEIAEHRDEARAQGLLDD